MLFRTLIIHAADEYALADLDSKPYESLKETSFQCLQLVRHFDIHADFRHRLTDRCPHTDYCFDEEYMGGSYPVGVDAIEKLGFKILRLLEQLKKKNLRSFR